MKVTNLANGKDVIVRVNDRGPFVDTRVIDLSKKTAEVLDFKNKGKTQVRVQFIGPAPLNDNGSHLMAMNKELDRGTSLRTMIAAADRHKGKAAPSNVMIAEAAPAKRTAAPVAKAETVAYVPPAAGAGARVFRAAGRSGGNVLLHSARFLRRSGECRARPRPVLPMSGPCSSSN